MNQVGAMTEVNSREGVCSHHGFTDYRAVNQGCAMTGITLVRGYVATMDLLIIGKFYGLGFPMSPRCLVSSFYEQALKLKKNQNRNSQHMTRKL